MEVTGCQDFKIKHLCSLFKSAFFFSREQKLKRIYLVTLLSKMWFVWNNVIMNYKMSSCQIKVKC